jgi:hypothetical protein
MTGRDPLRSSKLLHWRRWSGKKRSFVHAYGNSEDVPGVEAGISHEKGGTDWSRGAELMRRRSRPELR